MKLNCVGVLDYGIGNITSIMNALSYLDIDRLRVTAASKLGQCSHLILPGVGAFANGMNKLLSSDLHSELMGEVVDKGKPILGICLGMQMLSDVSFEFGIHDGLGLIHGQVIELESRKLGFPLPHIGWSEVRSDSDLVLLSGIESVADFYFLHSFHMQPKGDVATATSNHGVDFVAAVESGNVFGTQFHPEKSQRNGLALLKNFSKVN